MLLRQHPLVAQMPCLLPATGPHIRAQATTSIGNCRSILDHNRLQYLNVVHGFQSCYSRILLIMLMRCSLPPSTSCTRGLGLAQTAAASGRSAPPALLLQLQLVSPTSCCSSARNDATRLNAATSPEMSYPKGSPVAMLIACHNVMHQGKGSGASMTSTLRTRCSLAVWGAWLR